MRCVSIALLERPDASAGKVFGRLVAAGDAAIPLTIPTATARHRRSRRRAGPGRIAGHGTASGRGRSAPRPNISRCLLTKRWSCPMRCRSRSARVSASRGARSTIGRRRRRGRPLRYPAGEARRGLPIVTTVSSLCKPLTSIFNPYSTSPREETIAPLASPGQLRLRLARKPPSSEGDVDGLTASGYARHR
jgi:hypothetical protein